MSRDKEILRTEIERLEKELDESLLDEYYTNKLEEEKTRLQMVKESVWILNKAGYLKSSYHPDRAERLTIRHEKEEKKGGLHLKQINPSLLISMILFGIGVILFLGSWIQINGYEVDLLNFSRLIERVDSYLGDYAALDNVKTAIGFSLTVQWAIAGCYVYLMYKMFRTQEPRSAYIIPLLTVAVIVCLFLITEAINSEVNRALGFNIIVAELTNRIWYTLIIACLACVIYVKQKEINHQLFGIETPVRTDEIVILPVINYYPWEEIRFIDIVFDEKNGMSIYLKYNFPPSWRLIGLKEKWPGPIKITADIQFVVSGKAYVISDYFLTIKWDKPEGRTEKIFIDSIPIKLNDIEEAKVIIKTIEMPGESQKKEIELFAASDMDSKALANYRKQIGDPVAICHKKVMEKEWICVCGFAHDISQSKCLNCGAYLNTPNFISK